VGFSFSRSKSRRSAAFEARHCTLATGDMHRQHLELARVLARCSAFNQTKCDVKLTTRKAAFRAGLRSFHTIEGIAA
jgi:hypothetical protein